MSSPYDKKKNGKKNIYFFHLNKIFMSNRLNARQWSPPGQNINVPSFDISIVLPSQMCFDFHLKLFDVLYYGLLHEVIL